MASRPLPVAHGGLRSTSFVLRITQYVLFVTLASAISSVRQAEAAGPALTRGPYLQSVTATSAIVVWRTDVAGDSQIDYGVGNLSQSIRDPTATTDHAITLTGLFTGTSVNYRVLTGGVELAAASFRTASAPGSPFSFAVVGDSGNGSVAQYSVADRIVALDPDFVLHTGDVIYPKGQASGYDPYFFRPYVTLLRRAPIFPVLGNHDDLTQNGQPYLDAFYLPHNNPANTERYYSFDWGDAHFTALDFDDGPSARQLAWLQSDLASTDKTWKFVAYHQAIYSSGPHGYEPYIIDKRSVLAPILAAHQVDVVFNGHDHDYERTVPISNVVYIVSGGGGAGLYPIAPQSFSAYAASTYHTVYATIAGCTLSLQAIKPDGTVFDSTSLTHNCAAPTPGPAPTLNPVVPIELTPLKWIYLPIRFKGWND